MTVLLQLMISPLPVFVSFWGPSEADIRSSALLAGAVSLKVSLAS